MDIATREQTQCSAGLCPAAPKALAAITQLEEIAATLPQVKVVTEHMLHGGMYARTIRIPAGTVLTGALVKIPTLLVVHGEADVLTGDGWASISGFGVLAGAALRKQVFVTRSAVEMTMVFPTQVTTVDEAEREFTDEYERLMSRRSE